MTQVNKSRWMGNLTDEQKSKPMFDIIVLPASHDSGAYDVNLDLKLVPYTNSNGRMWHILNKIPCARRIIHNITKTQNRSIYEQLELGIRVLDLRVSYVKSENSFYIFHTYPCIPLSQVLDQVHEFLINNPTEIVILLVKPDHNSRFTISSKEIEISLIETFDRKFGLFGYPVSDGPIETKSINDLLNSKRRLIFYYQPQFPATKMLKHTIPVLFPDDMKVINNWQNTDDVKNLLTSLKEVIDKPIIYKKGFYGLSYIMTPQSRTLGNILKLLSVSIEDYAKKCDKNQNEVIRHIKNNKISWFTIDYVNEENVNKILGLNVQLYD